MRQSENTTEYYYSVCALKNRFRVQTRASVYILASITYVFSSLNAAASSRYEDIIRNVHANQFNETSLVFKAHEATHVSDTPRGIINTISLADGICDTRQKITNTKTQSEKLTESKKHSEAYK